MKNKTSLDVKFKKRKIKNKKAIEEETSLKIIIKKNNSNNKNNFIKMIKTIKIFFKIIKKIIK